MSPTLDALWREHRLPRLLAKYDELSDALCMASVYGGMALYGDPDNPVVADALNSIERQRDECCAVYKRLRALAAAELRESKP